MSARTTKGGNAHQIAVELAAILQPQLKRIETRLDRLIRAFRNHDLKADGEADATHPWLKLERDRCVQVQAVFEFMQERRKQPADVNTIPRACRATFTPLKKGYPSPEALANYCYSLPITDFI